MKKNILIFCLFLLSIPTINAQLLWKITGNGLKHPSYLFGTQHDIPISFLDSIPGLYKAFNGCEMVIGEMVLSNIDATVKIQQAAVMPNHIKMNDLLSDDEYKLIDQELKTVLKMNLKDVSIMNPSSILILYELELYKKRTSFSDDIQSDSYFQLVAIEKSKKVIGLETIEQQISFLFENGSLERQADKLVESIKRKDSIIKHIVYINKLYKAGKIEKLNEIARKNGYISSMNDEEYAKLVDNRNADWMTKLPSFFKQSPCFVAVGSMHLGGKKGLIKLLEKAGYKVIVP